jgi:DMSO/TMAO reductase YedYZ molybdopterin-dependent catalytic subunit
MADVLTIDGEVQRPLKIDAAELAEIAPEFQVPDVSTLDPKRTGRAVRLVGLLKRVGVREETKWLTLHAEADDFHASIPLDAVCERAVIIYSLDGGPLPVKAGGPFRFFIADHAACKTHEIDECANVKFVDRIELSRVRGHDNRPHDEAEHTALHQRQG